MSSEGHGHDEPNGATSLWWLFMLAGLVSVGVGVLVLTKPGNSLKTLAVIAGVLVLIEGVLTLVTSLRDRTQSRALAAIVGVVGVVVGVLLIRHPIGGVLAAALLIGIWLMAIGVVGLMSAFQGEHGAWKVVVALIELVAGIVIVTTPPISFATLALLVGLAFIINGVGTFALGWSMHTLRRATPRARFDATATA